MTRLLVVEDDPDTQTILHDCLEPLAAVVLAASVAEALSAAAAEPPDLALLDIALPDGDGVSLFARLRALPGLSGLRAIGMTAYGDAQTRRAVREAPFETVLWKPVDVREVVSAVRGALGGPRSP